MGSLSNDEIKELINTFNGALLITFYRSFDLGYTDLSKLIDDIKDDKKIKDTNHISIDVSDMPDLCSELSISPPCTILYENGEKRYSFGPFYSYDYIQEVSNNFFLTHNVEGELPGHRSLHYNTATVTVTQPNCTVTFNTGV